MGIGFMEAAGVLSFLMIVMSAPLAVILYMRFAKSKYGRILAGILIFVISTAVYLGLKSLEPGGTACLLVDISELAACVSIFYTSIVMWRTFLPGVSL
ncbi:MAG: hypothetical protein PHG85_07365 [Candidatus Altiarchaeota archaeon]|nr:hypothetical protein [Candidatus Altiarchaeota archaeon]